MGELAHKKSRVDGDRLEEGSVGCAYHDDDREER